MIRVWVPPRLIPADLVPYGRGIKVAADQRSAKAERLPRNSSVPEVALRPLVPAEWLLSDPSVREVALGPGWAGGYHPAGWPFGSHRTLGGRGRPCSAVSC